jgi:NADH-quinone oxidoreductase subunit G
MEFEKADAVVLVGCNPRREAPLLNVRLRRGVMKRGLKVLNIGAAADLTYPHTQLGDTAAALAEIGQALAGKTNIHVLVGAQTLARSDAALIMAEAAKLGTLQVLEASCGFINNQAVGAHQTELAETLKAWKSGKLNALWVHAEGSVSAEDIKAGEGPIVFVGTHLSPLAKLAAICLPAATWAETQGLWMNAEARVQEAQATTLPPLQAKEAWKIYRAVSEELGTALPWNTLGQLREKLAVAHPAFAPALLNQVQAKPLTIGKPSGKMLAKKFTESIPAYYIRTSYLQQSPTMMAMQIEAGTAQLGKVA